MREAYLVQIVVLANELLQLRLNIDNLLSREVKLHDGYPSLLQMLQEPYFRGLQEHQTAALSVRSTGCTTNTVNVVTRVIWGVELDNPVHGGNLEQVRQV